MSYHYYIATAGSPLTSWTEIYLSNEVEATKKLWEDEKFSREELSDLKIQKSRNTAFYSTLETWWGDSDKFSDEIGVEVYRGARSGGDRYFKGFVSVSDMAYDAEKAYFEFSPRIDDDYRELLEKKDVEYDIKGTLTGLDVIYTAGDQSITSWANGGAHEYEPYDTFVSSGSLISTATDASGAYVCECFTALTPFATTGIVILIQVTGFSVTGANPWVDIVQFNNDIPPGFNESLTDGAHEITGDGTYCFEILDTGSGNPYISIYTSTSAAATTTFSLDMSYRRTVGTEYDGIKWIDFLEFFVTNSSFMNLTGFTGKVLSTFLNNDSVPTAGPSTIDTWITANPDGNYASVNTGSNPLTSFVISETELWCDASTNDFKVSFSDIMSDIRETLQAWWYIDESGNLRVEHLSWFEYLFRDSTGIVLTATEFDKYRPLSDSQKFTFNKSKLSSREQFKWPQYEGILNGGIENFPGRDIIYDELESIENIEKHELGRVTTDVQYLLDNAADASGDGYLFLHTLQKCDWYEVQYEDPLILGTSRLNNHFAWGNLHPRYWTWGRMSQNGSMNGAATTFNSAVRFLEQTVKFGHQSTLDIFERIITPQGNGFQLETKRNLDTDFLTIKLGYDPYA